MYKVNASLESETEEIGRARIFPAGWLENESVWSHMEYKYLLEILRSGLHKEFFETIYDVLVPFLNPEQYGRSILENSSFIVSSVHEDESLHGRGFVARLSGSTAEVIHIWMLMNMGPQPFFLNERGELNLRFRPVLDKRLFTTKKTVVEYLDSRQTWKKITLSQNTYAFKLLGSTLVVYHNKKRKDTFSENGCTVERIELTYPNRKRPVILAAETISSPYAQQIREHKVDRIDIFFN
jgi:hypothetical protein